MKKLITVMMLVCVAACSPDKKSLAEPSSNPDSGEDTNFQSTDSPLYLEIGARWEMEDSGPYDIQPALDPITRTVKPCSIPRLASQGAEIDCIFRFPEARLYYSDLKFMVGTTMSASCPLLSFSPYYYMRSRDDEFQPAGKEVKINCDPATRTSNDPACYGGAAPAMIAGFPKSTGTYFNTNIMSQAIYPLLSENSTRMYGGAMVNYLANNTITAPTSSQGGNGPQARVGGSEWRDYSVECTNMWGEMMYKINFWIEDENVDPAPGQVGQDQFTDWP